MTRMLPSLAVAAALTFPALVAVAEGGPAPDRVEHLVGVIEASGCLVSEANERQILKDAGMTEAEGSMIVVHLMTTGRAVGVGDDVLKLISEACPK